MFSLMGESFGILSVLYRKFQGLCIACMVQKILSVLTVFLGDKFVKTMQNKDKVFDNVW